jgi:hypothetical protein
LDLSMTHSSPVAATRTRSMLFGPGGKPDIALLRSGLGGTNSMIFPTGPNPPGAHYTAIVYSFFPWPFRITSHGTTSLGTRVGAVPEPSTLILFGTGLAYGAYARRRKRSAKGC